MRIAPLVLAGCLAACGAADRPASSEAPAAPAPEGTVASPAEAPSSVPATEVVVADEDPSLRCTTDGDCVVGGPGRCCASSGPGCEQAWSRAAWEAHQAECEATECDRVMMMACPDRTGPEPVAACVSGQCVLR